MPAERSLYRRLVPFGSRRDRVLWIAIVTLRKTKEGPGPWFRAVKKGIYHLLPPDLQKRLLRWTGQDRFFRQDAMRHAAADAGAERPGLVSVVLPVFNQADMVAESIDSVLAQSYEQLELIVVDDGSTDGLHDAVRPYLDDPRVRIVAKPNERLPKALSTGFDHATGEFFTWTSADNWMHPQQLERLVAFLREQGDTAMVYCDYEVIDDRGEMLVGGEFRVMDRTDKDNPSAVRVNRSTHDLNRYEDNFIGPCFMYRGQVGRLLGDYNPELGLEDYDYWMRVNRLFRLSHLGTDELLYRYRVHDNTLSAKAHELKIFDRAKRLMVHERERGAWFDQAFRIWCSEGEREWVEGLGESVVETPASDADTKQLWIVRPEQLETHVEAGLPEGATLAVWFDEVPQVYAARRVLRHPGVVAFAKDTDTAARLTAFTRRVFPGERDQEALGIARRFANNSSFVRRTRSAEAMHRSAPRPLQAEDPTRVLIQVETLGRGGLERALLDLAAHLAAHHCEVHLLVRDLSAPAHRSLPSDVHVLESRPGDAAAYGQLLDELRIQVVSAHASTFGASEAAARGVPFVQVIQNSYVWMDRHDIEALREADPHTAAYICVSGEVLSYTDLRLQLDVQKMLVIDNGVSAATPTERQDLRTELGLADDDFVFLQVASLNPAKAHRASAAALARVRTQHGAARRIRICCLGGEMNALTASELRSDIASLGLEEEFVFAGHREDAASFYSMADAFLLPSYWEGCSLAVWEAIAHGLPLVLSDVGAAREQLAHGHGRIVAPPFEGMLALDASTIPGVLHQPDDGYVDRLAQAMTEVLSLERKPSAELPPKARHEVAAERQLTLIRWLIQGGAVPGIRETIALMGG